VVAVTLLIAIAAGAVGLSILWRGGPASRAADAQPALEATRTAIVALGRLDPRSEIIKLFAARPDRLDHLLIKRGDRVEQGQTLGYLASYPTRVAEREERRAKFVEAKAQLAATISLGEADVREAEVQSQQITEVSPLRIKNQVEYIGGIAAQLENNRDILRARATLREHDFMARLTYETQRALVRANEAAINSAQARLDELKRQFQLDQVEYQEKITQARAEAQRAAAAIPVGSLEQASKIAEAEVELATITAPISGRILNILARPGQEVGQNPILMMGDTSRMHAVAEVYETDVGFLRLGLDATVKSQALPKPLHGTVVEIGQMIFKNDVLDVDPAARADARVVEVRVELEPNEQIEHLTNLTVDVEIPIPAPADPPRIVGRQ